MLRIFTCYLNTEHPLWDINQRRRNSRKFLRDRLTRISSGTAKDTEKPAWMERGNLDKLRQIHDGGGDTSGGEI